MNDHESVPEVAAETSEQALARVEAECGWSDALTRIVELLPGSSAGGAYSDPAAA